MSLPEIKILLVFIFLDYLTGVILAISEKQINSTIGRKGIFSKVGILLCVVFCKLIDTLQVSGITPIFPLVTLFFILNESFSILENLGKLNVPIPKILISTLKDLQEREDKNEQDENQL